MSNKLYIEKLNEIVDVRNVVDRASAFRDLLPHYLRAFKRTRNPLSAISLGHSSYAKQLSGRPFDRTRGALRAGRNLASQEILKAYGSFVPVLHRLGGSRATQNANMMYQNIRSNPVAQQARIQQRILKGQEVAAAEAERRSREDMRFRRRVGLRPSSVGLPQTQQPSQENT